MSSVAVFTRISECDLPFYRQWLEYYSKIGVDSFYVVGDQSYKDLPFLKEYNVNFFNCIHYEIEKEKMNFFQTIIKIKIKEDYVLMIDVDEYLAYSDIKEIIKDNKDLYFFSWFMMPSIFSQYDNMYKQSLNVKGFDLMQGKSLHKISKIDTVFDYHSFNKPISRIDETNNSLYHFRFRGLKDIINKCCTSNGYTEWHKKDSEKIKQFLSNDKMKLIDIPNRIILAAAEHYCQNKKENKILPIICESKTDESYFNYSIDTNIFKNRFKLFLNNIREILKDFEFSKQHCKYSLIQLLKKHEDFLI